MKHFVIPAAVLTLLLGLSLENARQLEQHADRWLAALDEVTASAEREDWVGALDTLGEARADWEARKPWLHVVTAHDELEAADALFAAAESFAAERAREEFHAEMAELAVQLRVVADMQKLTLRNIL